VKSLQFVALVLTALALVPGAHLFALPNKIHLSESSYFVAQTIYRGWALLGIVLIAALLANVSLAVLMRAQRVPFIFLAITTLCLFATLAIFFAFTFPANQATNNWTQIPANGEHLRWQAMGSLTRRECGDHIRRLLFADDLDAIGARVSARTRQNGISSSMSSCLPPAPAIAGLRSRDAVGPVEPKSPLSAPAPPPPARSSMVSAELKPCSTTSVE
jgi:hypothetical protein